MSELTEPDAIHATLEQLVSQTDFNTALWRPEEDILLSNSDGFLDNFVQLYFLATATPSSFVQNKKKEALFDFYIRLSRKEFIALYCTVVKDNVPGEVLNSFVIHYPNESSSHTLLPAGAKQRVALLPREAFSFATYRWITRLHKNIDEPESSLETLERCMSPFVQNLAEHGDLIEYIQIEGAKYLATQLAKSPDERKQKLATDCLNRLSIIAFRDNPPIEFFRELWLGDNPVLWEFAYQGLFNRDIKKTVIEELPLWVERALTITTRLNKSKGRDYLNSFYFMYNPSKFHSKERLRLLEPYRAAFELGTPQSHGKLLEYINTPIRSLIAGILRNRFDKNELDTLQKAVPRVSFLLENYENTTK